MFIIFGSPRSGTTLLATTLCLNDNIVIPQETDFIIPTAFIIDRVKDQKTGKKLIRKLIISTERFTDSIGEYLSKRDIKRIVSGSKYSMSEMITNIYQAIANKAKVKMAGDKSPNDLNFLRILIKTGLLDSDIQIIHIIRDIRDIMLSLKRVNWSAPDIEMWFPRFWSNSNIYLHDIYKSKSDKYILIKYEDMIMSPLETFKKITNFIGVPFQEKMFDNIQITKILHLLF